MQPILELKNICFSYHSRKGETKALLDVSFSMAPGDFTAIVGPSGCGKSTLLSIIAGLLTPEKGFIKMNGEFLKGPSINIGYMLQQDYLLEWRTVYKNVILGLEIRRLLNGGTKERAISLLDGYGLSRFKNSRPSELSGGMRQRAALIRTLVLDPELLLLDEPFSALDYQTRLSVGEDISRIIRKEKKTALLITHDLAEAISLADRIIIMTKRPGAIGRIIDLSFSSQEGSALARRNAPEFKKYFKILWKELDKND